jgi:hypothetical protein
MGKDTTIEQMFEEHGDLIIRASGIVEYPIRSKSTMTIMSRGSLCSTSFGNDSHDDGKFDCIHHGALLYDL